MIFKAYDNRLNKNIELNLEINYTFEARNLYGIFYNEKATTTLGIGSVSPFNEFCFKKIQQIVVATTLNDGFDYTLTIGYYFTDMELIPFLINEQTPNTEFSEFRFRTTKGRYNRHKHPFDFLKIIDYNEYKFLAKHLGLEKLSFLQFVEKIINNEIDLNNYKLFDTSPCDYTDYTKYITKKEFKSFLDKVRSK